MISKGSKPSLRSAQGRQSAGSSEGSSERGQILLMLDRPAGQSKCVRRGRAEPGPGANSWTLTIGAKNTPLHSSSDRSDVEGRSIGSFSGPSLSSASRSTSSHGRLSLTEMAPPGQHGSRNYLDRRHTPDLESFSPHSLAPSRKHDDHVKILDEPLGDLDFREYLVPTRPSLHRTCLLPPLRR